MFERTALRKVCNCSIAMSLSTRPQARAMHLGCMQQRTMSTSWSSLRHLLGRGAPVVTPLYACIFSRYCAAHVISRLHLQALRSQGSATRPNTLQFR